MRPHRMVLGLLAGLIVGSAISASDSPALLNVVRLIEPVGSLWVSAIRMTVVPLVVSLLFASVASDASGEGVGRIGIVTVATFFGLLCFSAAVALFIARPLIDDMKLTADVAASLRSTASAGATETAALVTKLPGLGSWLTSLVPPNVIRAATDGSILPLIVFTLVFALAARQIDATLRSFDGYSTEITRP